MRAWTVGLAIGAVACGKGAPASTPATPAAPLIIEIAAPRPSSLRAAPAEPFDDALLDAIRARPEVDAVTGAVLLVMPAVGHGTFAGDELHFEVGGFADGIDPAYVAGELGGGFRDFDAGGPARAACTPDGGAGCDAASYCDELDRTCHRRVPVIVSPFLLDRYVRSYAPAHGLPPMGDPRARIAKGETRFDIILGESMVGGSVASSPKPHRVGAVVVGVSRASLAIGLSLPAGYVRRWLAEYSIAAPPGYHRVSMRLRDRDRIEDVAAWLRGRGFDLDSTTGTP